MALTDNNEWFRENSEKNLKKKSDFWGVDGPSLTDLGIDFLNDSNFFQIFWDLILIELAKGFDLRCMRVLRSHKLKNYYVITKKLR